MIWTNGTPNKTVDHPSHYNVNGIECFDVIDALDLNFNMGNVMKYIFRAGRKGDKLEDLQKAMVYLDREIQRLEKTNGSV